MLIGPNVQFPAQQFGQQRVAQGGEGAGLVEVCADFREDRCDCVIESDGYFSRREYAVLGFESLPGYRVEDGSVRPLPESGDGLAEAK